MPSNAQIIILNFLFACKYQCLIQHHRYYILSRSLQILHLPTFMYLLFNNLIYFFPKFLLQEGMTPYALRIVGFTLFCTMTVTTADNCVMGQGCVGQYKKGQREEQWTKYKGSVERASYNSTWFCTHEFLYSQILILCLHAKSIQEFSKGPELSTMTFSLINAEI